MNKKKDEMVNQEQNAQVIVARIREESAQETARVLEQARLEAEKIIREASGESDRRRVQMLAGMRQELEKTRERIFSSVNLEKKRLVLEEKNAFIQQVLRGVRECAGRFRETPGYDDFLRRAVVEGARVVGKTELEVAYAPADERLFCDRGFLQPLESLCREGLKEAVTFKYVKGDFTEPGVIVSSVDGRIQFDNRFSSRLSRLEGDIYVRLLKEF